MQFSRYGHILLLLLITLLVCPAYGQTDATGDKVVANAMGVSDLLATMATLLGMDPGHAETSPAGRPIAVTDAGVAIKALIA